MFRLAEQGLEEQLIFVATVILLVFLLGAIRLRAGMEEMPMTLKTLELFTKICEFSSALRA